MTIGISLLFIFSCTWCLYNLSLGETFRVECEEGWTVSPYSGTCLKLFNAEGPWTHAKEFCQNSNAALLKVIDSKMNDFVLNILTGEDPYYIGLILDDVKKKMVWLDEDEEAGYTAFTRRKTMLIEGAMCAVVSNQQGRVDLLWDAVDCASPQKFLCVNRPSEGNCSTGWTYIKDNRDEEHAENEYCFQYERYNATLSWEDARQFCMQENADLAKIYTYTLDRLIFAFLSESEGELFYIGLKVNNKKPFWLDEQESAEDYYYLGFTPGQINKGGNLCGQINNQSVPTGEWALVNCESSHKFICERDKGLCPYGWIPSASSGTCIKIYHTPVTESQAVQRCQDDGANLVTILNEQMQQFVTDQVIWDSGFAHLIGLNDKRKEHQYRWLDFNEPINYTKWANQGDLYPEPADPDNEYECAFIMLQEFYQPGYWAVYRCNGLAKTICEKFADCSKESYGMLCPKECQNCKESPLSEPCNPRFGMCYYGYSKCPLGTYGTYCAKRCNEACGGEGNDCSQEDGSCLNGCDEGYEGKSCDETVEVKKKTKGASSSTCPVWITIVIPCVTMLIVTV